MPKHTLVFPEPAEGADEMPVEIDNHRFVLPNSITVLASAGYQRRIRDIPDGDAQVFTLFELAVEDDKQILHLIDYLTNEQWLELVTKWGEFSRAALPESSAPSGS